jgi:hypothetical protein
LPLKSFVTFQKHRQSSHDLITLKSWFNNFRKLYQETQSISKHEKKGNTNTKQARTKSVLPECLQDKKHKEKTIDMENKGNTDTKQAKKEDQCPRP